MQAVFFRDSTRQRAEELGLCGWVKNLNDGRVEVVFVGEEIKCEEALAYIRVGPPMASVTRVQYVWEDPPEDITQSFEIRV